MLELGLELGTGLAARLHRQPSSALPQTLRASGLQVQVQRLLEAHPKDLMLELLVAELLKQKISSTNYLLLRLRSRTPPVIFERVLLVGLATSATSTWLSGHGILQDCIFFCFVFIN